MDNIISLDEAFNAITADSLLNHVGNLIEYDTDIYYLDKAEIGANGYLFLYLTDMSHNHIKLTLQILIYSGLVSVIYIAN